MRRHNARLPGVGLVSDFYSPLRLSRTDTANESAAPPKLTTSQPSFAQEIAYPAGKNSFYEGFYTAVGNCLGTIGAFPGCCCFPNAYQTVPMGSVGLISRYGKFYKSVDPGLHFVLPVVENLQLVDIKVQVEDIPRQTVTTKDNVSIMIDSVLYWHILDPVTAAFLVSDVRLALMERTQTTLRQVLGTRVLQDAIESESLASVQRLGYSDFLLTPISRSRTNRPRDFRTH